MTPEQITKWAVEVGMPTVSEFGYTRLASPKQLQAFAQLVRNATLEEAALRFDGIDTGGAGFYEAEPANIIRSMKS